ncbi:hypothetical protein V496_09251 [Pseudogymnoascus sp. VKM F-4515 (FW-2607)]|nr:hypothetical protein V496_09251 [Pseudogymnoascus sp. VKM F-4515 (FW-2607)]
MAVENQELDWIGIALYNTNKQDVMESGVVLGGPDKAGMVQYMKLRRKSSKYATVPAMREGQATKKRTWHLEASMSHRQRNNVPQRESYKSYPQTDGAVKGSYAERAKQLSLVTLFSKGDY